MVYRMRALPCLLLLLGAALGAIEPPTPPQTPPIVYPQPVAHSFLLRIDNRRYELDDMFKEPVARLLGAANYAQTKALYDIWKRTLSERLQFEAPLTRAQSLLTQATARVERTRLSLDTLRQRRNAYRTSDKIDLQELLRMDNAILAETAALERAEEMEEKATAKVADAQRALAAFDEKHLKAGEAYVAALKEYDRTLGEIRAIAIGSGRAL